METGNRKSAINTYTGTAVSQTVDPSGPFQLIDVAIELSAAATTSENIVISSVRDPDGENITFEEYTYDPSLTTKTDLPFRFDKRFAYNSTADSGKTTLKVEYANTDALTIKVITTYQLDQSVV